jgi:NAD(P)H-nitrite reductase large subunit
MRYVIAGFSIAGVSAARAIRQKDPEAEVIAITDEPEAPYYRPLIPLVVEGRQIDINFADTLEGIETVHGKVTGLDLQGREFVLEDGTGVEFDRALIATGARALVPEVPGMDSEGVFTFRTYRDALRLRQYSEGRHSAVVLGGGLVGVKAAVALAERGLQVTMIEMLPEILQGRIDPEGATRIRTAMEAEGIRVLTSETVEEVLTEKGRVEGVRTASGQSIRAEMVVVATGVRPSVDFLDGSPVKVHRGILVDDHLCASVPGVYAAGDVAEHRDLLTGSPATGGLWSTAEEMGRIAGTNMAGGALRYEGMMTVMNATEILGNSFISIGLIDENLERHELRTSDGYRRFYFEGDTLKGLVFYNDLNRAGLYGALIRNRMDVSRYKELIITDRLSYAHLQI